MKNPDTERDNTNSTPENIQQHGKDESPTEMFPKETNKPAQITTAHLSGEISSAKCVIKEWSDELVAAVAGTRKTRDAALAAIYKVYWPMYTDEKLLRDFYNKYNIKQHGNAQIPASSFVKYLLHDADKMCRSQTTKFAGAIGWAASQGIESEQFASFMEKEKGYTNAYQKFADAQDSNGDRKAARKLEERRQIEEFVSGSPSPEYQTPKILEEHVGQVIALLYKPEPDTFHISAILYSNPSDVDKFILQTANTVNKRGQK